MSQLRTNPPRGCATLPALFFDAYRGAVGYLVGCLNDVARLSAGGIGPYVDVGQTRVVAAGYGKALLPVVGRILVPDDEGYKHVAMAARVRQRRFSLDDEASGRVQLGLIEAGLKLGISERLIGKRHVFAVPHCAGAIADRLIERNLRQRRSSVRQPANPYGARRACGFGKEVSLIIVAGSPDTRTRARRVYLRRPAGLFPDIDVSRRKSSYGQVPHRRIDRASRLKGTRVQRPAGGGSAVSVLGYRSSHIVCNPNIALAVDTLTAGLIETRQFADEFAGFKVVNIHGIRSGTRDVQQALDILCVGRHPGYSHLRARQCRHRGGGLHRAASTGRERGCSHERHGFHSPANLWPVGLSILYDGVLKTGSRFASTPRLFLDRRPIRRARSAFPNT